jgi:hypothetical protein
MLQKWVMDALFKFPKLHEDVVGIISITKSIEINGLERKSGGPLQQSGLSQKYIPRQIMFMPRNKC